MAINCTSMVSWSLQAQVSYFTQRVAFKISFYSAIGWVALELAITLVSLIVPFKEGSMNFACIVVNYRSMMCVFLLGHSIFLFFLIVVLISFTARMYSDWFVKKRKKEREKKASTCIVCLHTHSCSLNLDFFRRFFTFEETKKLEIR